MATREALKEAFAVFDQNGSGTLSPDEVVAILTRGSSALTEEDALELLHGADTNGDGELDFEEFANSWGRFEMVKSMAKGDLEICQAEVAFNWECLEKTGSDVGVANFQNYREMLEEDGTLLDDGKDGPLDTFPGYAEMLALRKEESYRATDVAWWKQYSEGLEYLFQSLYQTVCDHMDKRNAMWEEQYNQARDASRSDLETPEWIENKMAEKEKLLAMPDEERLVALHEMNLLTAHNSNHENIASAVKECRMLVKTDPKSILFMHKLWLVLQQQALEAKLGKQK